MAEGLAILIGQGLSCFWIEPDITGDSISHSSILERLEWNDSENRELRRFVRVQVPSWNIENFEFDEDNSIPGWAENNIQEIKEAVEKILDKIFPIKEKFEEMYGIMMDDYYARRIKNPQGDVEYGISIQMEAALTKKREELNDIASLEYSQIRGYVPKK
jgi:Txe/YoeB family toxin of Txe-Axe toxin-antitoxin module